MRVMDLHDYDRIEISNSAGKDSVAMIVHVVALADSQAFPRHRIHVVHADLGRVEWTGTKALAQEQAEFYGLDFRTVKRKQGDLIDHIKHLGIFPTPTRRFCTSDHKRSQIHRALTQIAKEVRATDPETFRRSGSDRREDVREVRILSCVGFRAEESPGRAKAEEFSVDAKATGKGKMKRVDMWLPIQDWTLDKVWSTIKDAGIPYHYAYDLGMPRLSCVFCIFAPKVALLVAGKHNPELLAEYVELEAEIDFKFKQNLALAEIQQELNDGVDIDLSALKGGGCWNM